VYNPARKSSMGRGIGRPVIGIPSLVGPSNNFRRPVNPIRLVVIKTSVK